MVQLYPYKESAFVAPFEIIFWLRKPFLIFLNLNINLIWLYFCSSKFLNLLLFIIKKINERVTVMHLKLIPCGSELYRCACIKKKKKNYRCERVGVCGVTCRNWGSLQTSPFKLSVCCIFALFSLPKPQYINPFSLSSLLYTPLLFFSTYINNPLINSTILFSNFNNLFN